MWFSLEEEGVELWAFAPSEVTLLFSARALALLLLASFLLDTT